MCVKFETSKSSPGKLANPAWESSASLFGIKDVSGNYERSKKERELDELKHHMRMDNYVAVVAANLNRGLLMANANKERVKTEFNENNATTFRLKQGLRVRKSSKERVPSPTSDAQTGPLVAGKNLTKITNSAIPLVDQSRLSRIDEELQQLVGSAECWERARFAIQQMNAQARVMALVNSQKESQQKGPAGQRKNSTSDNNSDSSKHSSDPSSAIAVAKQDSDSQNALSLANGTQNVRKLRFRNDEDVHRYQTPMFFVLIQHLIQKIFTHGEAHQVSLQLQGILARSTILQRSGYFVMKESAFGSSGVLSQALMNNTPGAGGPSNLANSAMNPLAKYNNLGSFGKLNAPVLKSGFEALRNAANAAKDAANRDGSSQGGSKERTPSQGSKESAPDSNDDEKKMAKNKTLFEQMLRDEYGLSLIHI